MQPGPLGLLGVAMCTVPMLVQCWNPGNYHSHEDGEHASSSGALLLLQANHVPSTSPPEGYTVLTFPISIHVLLKGNNCSLINNPSKDIKDQLRDLLLKRTLTTVEGIISLQFDK